MRLYPSRRAIANCRLDECGRLAPWLENTQRVKPEQSKPLGDVPAERYGAPT
jgi:hypothetical protein